MSQNKPIFIHINNQPLQVESGLTILQAARQNQIEIPTLCDFPGLPAHGSCRMCIVEIEGRSNTPTACTTPVEAGMIITTHSPNLEALRTEILQMLLAEHPAGCLFCPEKDHCDECMVTLRKAGVTTGCGSCPKDQQCELQALAVRYGIEKPAYPIRYRMLPVEKHDPFFDRDSNLCILCGRCIRICADLHFANSLSYSSRGSDALVSTAFQRSHVAAGCTFCGSCIEVCPTGALTEKTRKWYGKPERETQTTCPFCALGCQITLLSKNARVIGSLPNRQASPNGLCVKGRFAITELVNHATRLKHPQKQAGSVRQKIGWEEAVRSAAEKLANCAPGRFEMRISADCSTEDLFVARQFARDVMKSGNIITSAQAHYGSSIDSAARLVQKSGALELITAASVVLCVGLEDQYAQSLVGVHLHRAKQQGVKIIQISPRQRSWNDCADVWLQAGPNQEVDLLHRLLHLTGPAARVQPDGGQGAPDEESTVQAARMLQRPGDALILVGPAVLTDRAALQSIEQLLIKLSARVITLPDQTNLSAALRLGLCGTLPAPASAAVDVLYCIGAAPDESPAGQPFIILQAMLPPADACRVDLLLPTSAFSEEHATWFDYAGRVQAVHPAVPAPAEALSSWLIVCRIAQQMGAAGFDYTCVEDIWQAMQAELPQYPSNANWPNGWQADWPAAAAAVVGCPPRSAQWDPPAYMGRSLLPYVEGLCSLYPEKTNGNAHE